VKAHPLIMWFMGHKRLELKFKAMIASFLATSAKVHSKCSQGSPTPKAYGTKPAPGRLWDLSAVLGTGRRLELLSLWIDSQAKVDTRGGFRIFWVWLVGRWFPLQKQLQGNWDW
jgi:hypothetical protein